jgi:hypothetical protein
MNTPGEGRTIAAMASLAAYAREDDRVEVVVTDVQMPFMSMVLFMVKWSLASIPAFLILFALGAILLVLFASVFGGFPS